MTCVQFEKRQRLRKEREEEESEDWRREVYVQKEQDWGSLHRDLTAVAWVTAPGPREGRRRQDGYDGSSPEFPGTAWEMRSEEAVGSAAGTDSKSTAERCRGVQCPRKTRAIGIGI